MKIQERLRLLDRMFALIKRGGTGTPETFARRLGISLRTLHVYLDVIKSYEVEVTYDKERSSYICPEDAMLKFNPLE